MKKHWWKALSVLIVLYTIIAGLIIPLKPGILKIKQSGLNTGQIITAEVNTYNTRYENGDKLDAYLKINDKVKLYSSSSKILGKEKVELTFDVPAYLPQVKSFDYTLILVDPKHGPFVRPSAITLKQDKVDIEQALATWPKQNEIPLKFIDGIKFPFRTILYESIRNTFYHVPMWFAMVFILFAAMWYSIRYLVKPVFRFDIAARSLTSIGVILGILGCLTGSVWAKGTWGTWWTFQEIKLNVSAIALLIYFAYFILRSAIQDEEQKARVASVYNIFAFVAMVPLLFVVPRMVASSLHPGNGGNPGFGGEDLDNTLRMVFYPAIIGWTLFSFWLAELLYRYQLLQEKMDEEFD